MDRKRRKGRRNRAESRGKSWELKGGRGEAGSVWCVGWKERREGEKKGKRWRHVFFGAVRWAGRLGRQPAIPFAVVAAVRAGKATAVSSSFWSVLVRRLRRTRAGTTWRRRRGEPEEGKRGRKRSQAGTHAMEPGTMCITAGGLYFWYSFRLEILYLQRWPP